MVTILVGGNDIITGTDVEDFSNNLDIILKGLKDVGANVFVINTPNLVNYPKFVDGSYEFVTLKRINEFNQVSKEKADKYSFAYVNMFNSALSTDMSLISADGIHPTMEGHKIVANKIIEKMKGTTIVEGSEGFLSKEINFKAVDGQDVIGYLSKPEGSGKFPAIILIHGGESSQKATLGLGSGKHASKFNEEGYVVLAVDYRESEFGGKEIDDIEAGIRYLKTLNYVDGKKIGLFGTSHGAYRALMTASRAGDRVSAVVDNFAFTDLIRQYESVIGGETFHTSEKVQFLIDMGDNYFGGSPDESPEIYKERSPLYNVESIEAPILIIHGKNDESVLIEQSYLFGEALESAGKSYEIKFYDNGPHGFVFSGTPEALDAGKVTLDFFNKHLK